jgi:hypothetical protein
VIRCAADSGYTKHCDLAHYKVSRDDWGVNFRIRPLYGSITNAFPPESPALRAAHRGRKRFPHRGKSKRRHPRHDKIVETAKRLIVEWANELRAMLTA